MACILLIDDEPLFRLAASLVLRQAGYVVHCAASAEEAEHLLLSITPDLVILDLVMPGVGGLAFRRQAQGGAAWGTGLCQRCVLRHAGEFLRYGRGSGTSGACKCVLGRPGATQQGTGDGKQMVYYGCQ